MTSEKGIPVYKSPDYPETYGELIDWSIKRIKDPENKVLFRMSDSDIELTYSEFERNTNKICNLLIEKGVQKGDHIAVFLTNCVEYAYLYHALGKCGVVIAPINPFVRGDALEYILKHSESKYLVTSSELYTEKASRVIDLKNMKYIFFTDRKMETERVDSSLLSDFAKCPSDFEPKWKVTGDDIQGIWYTSGTTGVPKGAVINHKTYMYRVLWLVNYFRMTPEDVTYYILPMFHVAYAVLGTPLSMAAAAEFVQVPWFSVGNFWKDIVRFGATMTFSTGTIIPIVLNQPVTEDEISGKDKLRVWLGWPVDNPEKIRERWPNIKFIEGYGTTETPVATIADYENPGYGNAGPPAVYTDMKIIDPNTGEELPPNQVGEIVCSHKLGPDYIILEYYKDPENTKKMIKNGYWYSGDLGMLDENGCLVFVDRLKDYLRIGGENVSSSVVEDIVRKHPSVLEVGIVGRKGELGHDEIVAHVVPKEGTSIDPREFFEFCNDRMAYFMVPKYLIIRSELPKTGTLRIEKYKLRSEGVSSNAIDRSDLGIVLKR